MFIVELNAGGSNPRFPTNNIHYNKKAYDKQTDKRLTVDNRREEG